MNLTQHLDGDLQGTFAVPYPHEGLAPLPDAADKMGQLQLEGLALGEDRRLKDLGLPVGVPDAPIDLDGLRLVVHRDVALGLHDVQLPLLLLRDAADQDVGHDPVLEGDLGIGDVLVVRMDAPPRRRNPGYGG